GVHASTSFSTASSRRRPCVSASVPPIDQTTGSSGARGLGWPQRRRRESRPAQPRRLPGGRAPPSRRATPSLARASRESPSVFITQAGGHPAPAKEAFMYATLRVYEMAEDWDDVLHERLEGDFVPALERLGGLLPTTAWRQGPDSSPRSPSSRIAPEPRARTG